MRPSVPPNLQRIPPVDQPRVRHPPRPAIPVLSENRERCRNDRRVLAWLLMARRLTYIVASVEKAVAFEWLCDSIDRERFDLSFILLNPGRTELEDELQTRGVPSQRITYRGYGDLPRAFLETLRILRRSRPHIVHAHMLPACLVGLTAAKLARVPIRVYTRHHSVFHHDYAPRWVSVDRLMNRLATHIIAISENVYEVLHGLEGVPESKLHVIHHGFRVEDFDDVDQADVEALRAKYELRTAFPVIGVIARYMELKGIRDIVAAAPAILEQYVSCEVCEEFRLT